MAWNRVPGRSILAVLLLLTAAAAAFAVDGPRFHTRSIVSCDPSDETCGIAVVSFPTGVPAIVPVGVPGIIVANQSFPSLATARDVIARIQAGDDAPTALADALAGDPARELRQMGVAALDATAASGVTVANFTGLDNIPETCRVAGDTYAVQANLQTSSAVCQTMADAFEAAAGSLARRLLASLLAGTPVGTDARGEFSASIKVFSAAWPLADLSELVADAGVNRAVDWEGELAFNLNSYLAFLTVPDPRDNVELTKSLAQRIQRVLKDLGFYAGPVNGFWSDAAEAALLDFGVSNQVFPSGTVLDGGVRLVNGPQADYILEGSRRGVLTPAL